jgi:hypothetical protein
MLLLFIVTCEVSDVLSLIELPDTVETLFVFLFDESNKEEKLVLLAGISSVS